MTLNFLTCISAIPSASFITLWDILKPDSDHAFSHICLTLHVAQKQTLFENPMEHFVFTVQG